MTVKELIDELSQLDPERPVRSESGPALSNVVSDHAAISSEEGKKLPVYLLFYKD